jgi:hypothetical protein
MAVGAFYASGYPTSSASRQRTGGAPIGVSRSFKIRRRAALAASLARVRLTMSLSWPFGQRIRHMVGYVESCTIFTVGEALPPLHRRRVSPRHSRFLLSYTVALSVNGLDSFLQAAEDRHLRVVAEAQTAIRDHGEHSPACD